MSSHRRVPRPSICSHKMRDLTGRRKTACRFLMLVCVFRNFLNNFTIAIWRGDVALDSRGIEFALVFNIVERFNAGLCVDLPDLLASFEKDSFDPHAGVYRDRVVVHEPAVEDRLLNAVPENRFSEERDSMSGRCCR